jgi:hypothetical protein
LKQPLSWVGEKDIVHLFVEVVEREHLPGEQVRVLKGDGGSA